MKILKTAEFQKWFKKLSFTVRALITKRLLRVESGNLGDFKPVGDGVLLIGGDKGSQKNDIEKAKEIWRCLTKKP